MKKQKIKEKKPRYWSNFTAGVGLGLVLLFAYYIAGRGLGASGSISRTIAGLFSLVSPELTTEHSYFARYFGSGRSVISDWLIFQVIGVFLGGLFGAVSAGRFSKTVEKGENITRRQRFLAAVVGGMLMGWAARLARGCWTGQALTGGASMVLGSWAFILALFVGGFVTAIFFRRLWL